MARSKGAGTLIKRGKYWQCRIVVDGKPVYKATGTSSKVEAKKILEEFARPFRDREDALRLAAIEAEIKAKEESSSESDGYADVPLGDLVEKYFKTANAPDVSGGTREYYEHLLARFTSWLAENEPSAKEARGVTRPVAERYLAYLKPAVSASYFNGSLAMFRKIWKEFGRLSKHRCFRENPWDGYRYKTADVSTRRALTSAEIKKLFDACRTPDERTLFSIGLYTGLRVGDCATLKWSEIDFKRRVIVRTPIKTKRHGTAVTVPMHPALFAELETRSKSIGEGSEYVLPEDARHYLETSSCPASVRVFKRAGLEGVSFHSLRHTLCSTAFSAGIPLDVIKQIVGHSSAKMTEHYSHISTDALVKAIETLPNINAKIKHKSLVEVDSSLLKKLNELGTTVEDAVREFINMKTNTITLKELVA